HDVIRPTVTPDMIRLTDEEREAMLVLGSSSEQKAAHHLLRILDEDIRTEAKSATAYHLAEGHSEKEGVRDTIRTMALEHSDPKVRAAVIKGMKLYYTEWVEELVLEGLMDGHPTVATAASTRLEAMQRSYNTRYLSRFEIERMHPKAMALRARALKLDGIQHKDRILQSIDTLLSQIEDGFLKCLCDFVNAHDREEAELRESFN